MNSIRRLFAAPGGGIAMLALAIMLVSVSVRGQSFGNDNSLLVEHSDGGYYRSPDAAFMHPQPQQQQQHPGFGGLLPTTTGGRNGTDNRKPSFRDCATLSASVREEQQGGVFVIRMQADDPDVGDRIEYKLVNAVNERAKFRIEPRTGNIYTTYQFDRDEPAREKEVSYRCSVTVTRRGAMKCMLARMRR